MVTSRLGILLGSVPYVIARATLFDSVGFHRGLRFPPTLNYSWRTNVEMELVMNRRVL
jgi:hypothetical protein